MFLCCHVFSPERWYFACVACPASQGTSQRSELAFSPWRPHSGSKIFIVICNVAAVKGEAPTIASPSIFASTLARSRTIHINHQLRSKHDTWLIMRPQHADPHALRPVPRCWKTCRWLRPIANAERELRPWPSIWHLRSQLSSIGLVLDVQPWCRSEQLLLFNYNVLRGRLIVSVNSSACHDCGQCLPAWTYLCVLGQWWIEKRWNNNKTKDWGPVGRCRIVGSLATGGLAKYPLAYWAGLLLPSDSSGVLVAIKLVSVYRQSLRRRKSPVVEISPFLLVFESWSDLSVQLRAFSLLDILLYFASRRTLLPKRLWYSQWRRRYRLLSTRSSPDGRYMSLSHTRIGAGENAKGVDWYRMP